MTDERWTEVVQSLLSGKVVDWSGPPTHFFYFVLRSNAVDAVYGTRAGFDRPGIDCLPQHSARAGLVKTQTELRAAAGRYAQLLYSHRVARDGRAPMMVLAMRRERGVVCETEGLKRRTRSRRTFQAAFTVYTTRIDEFSGIHGVRREFFPTNAPASTMAPVIRMVDPTHVSEMDAVLLAPAA
jgi:hypothetical protein